MAMYNETMMLREPTAAADNGHKFACSYPECFKVYSRKYHLIKHLKEAHGIENDTECTRNFKYPFNCGIRAYRTNKELLCHCEAVHQDTLDS